MTSTMTCVKVALRREEGFPEGYAAPMFLMCLCGQKLPVVSNGAVCTYCHREYDERGWITAQARTHAKEPAAINEYGDIALDTNAR